MTDMEFIVINRVIKQLWREYARTMKSAGKESRQGYPTLAAGKIYIADAIRERIKSLEASIPADRQ